MKLKRDDRVEVEWLDQSYYHGPTEPTGATQECVGKTLGYFIEQDAKWLTLGMERFQTDRISYRHIVTFPKVAILKIVRR